MQRKWATRENADRGHAAFRRAKRLFQRACSRLAVFEKVNQNISI
jgi:hypothetical protein